MAYPLKDGLAAQITRLQNRLAARRAQHSHAVTGFVSQPEPRSIGLFARGKQLTIGNYLLAGHLIEAPGKPLWDAPTAAPEFWTEAHGFVWLDDLAAVGDPIARKRAQDWTWDWITRFGKGNGPGWTPDVTGRRLIRWIHHALFLLSGRSTAESQAYFHSLSAQTSFLSHRWQASAPGVPRFEALTGLIYAGLALTGMENEVEPAVAALALECEAEIDKFGGLSTRNPEELLNVFTLLTWAAQALAEAGQAVPQAQRAAIERIAPTLRTLRHADGSLARFHGGGRGMDGRLDHALAASGVKAAVGTGLAMGFLRLTGARTSVIIDASDPPAGRGAATAHASTLAFEMTSGRRPVIVNCGSGAPFGPDWLRAGRATPSHSTLTVEGYSSSRLNRGTPEVLADRAHVTRTRPRETADGHALRFAHNGWVATHGLTHARLLLLSHDGRHMGGQDELRAMSDSDRAQLARVQKRDPNGEVRFSIRFHLHPDVDAAIDLGGNAVSLALKSGEIWIFRHTGANDLSVEPSVYLEKGRLNPRASKQIVLSGHVGSFDAVIGWTLAKAQDTPLAIRDLERDDVPGVI
ncbi:heparinase [Pseudorhodobacter turbinis]|uniref:Heparinase n=1 Tax=Pseudorhodobacter turbinis TaxID=2500533 RepID=A0A4P8EHQ1_9RHOB|nr:heparinase II/III family protein [Pseudorhodobacter turbinis]QCO56105.1 heparinase [Pseudorhodobacter turbinis]